MKKLTALLSMLCVLALLLCGAAYPKPTRAFYANDYADVLSAETESYIVSQSASLAKGTGAQIVVLTVKTLDGEEPATYALNAGRQWGIGGREENNGLLLLLCPDEGEIYVAVGRGLEGALNDAKVGRMIDQYALPLYKNREFDAGTLELYKSLLSQTMQEYGLEALPGYEAVPEERGVSVPTLLIGFFIFIVLGSSLFGRRGPRNYHHRGGPPFMGGGFYGGGFGGGFGGGSSGGFSGGGGSFGGGGAGRKF